MHNHVCIVCLLYEISMFKLMTLRFQSTFRFNFATFGFEDIHVQPYSVLVNKLLYINFKSTFFRFFIKVCKVSQNFDICFSKTLFS